jgi:hypothetical protein
MLQAPIEQFRARLVENSPDSLEHVILPSPAVRDEGSYGGGRFEQFRSNLKIEKYQFLQNRELHSFIWAVDGYQKGDEPPDAQANRKAEKEQTAAVKQRIKQEEQTFLQLQSKTAEMYSENCRIHGMFHDEVQSTAGVVFDNPHHHAGDVGDTIDIEGITAVEENANHLRRQLGDQRLRRKELEEVLESLQQETRRSQEVEETSQRRYQREMTLFQCHERLAEGQMKLGYPVIQYDDSSCSMTLNLPEDWMFWPQAAVEAFHNIDAALRVITYGYGADGTIAWAKAHPRLEVKSLEDMPKPDIARLVSRVWIKLCEFGEQAELDAGTRRLSHCGA